MPATPLPSGGYSTNPNTVKARRRKMNRSEAENVEAAARQADYKAMLNARSKVHQDPAYALASESQKSTMLEMAMKETMDKRRAKGQDTMAKMAAFRAGVYRGSQTRVPIADFLRNNGNVPFDATGTRQRGAAAGGSSSRGVAPVADMEGGNSSFAGSYGMPGTPGGQSFMPNGHPASDPSRPGRRNVNLLDAQSLYSPTPLRIKPAPEAIATMSPEPMLATIEGDAPMADASESVTRLQTEVGHLRTICNNITANNKHNFEVIEADMALEKGRTQDHEVRIKQLEGMVHAMQNTSLSSIVERVNELERIVEQLRAKVGEGGDAEIANMREVMGGLKSLLDKVGGFA